MKCPICGIDVSPKLIEDGVWSKKYECPNCKKHFKKQTTINKATNIVGRVALMAFIGDVLGGADISGGSDGSI